MSHERRRLLRIKVLQLLAHGILVSRHLHQVLLSKRKRVLVVGCEPHVLRHVDGLNKHTGVVVGRG
jgi:hypothetical protein